MLLAPQQQFLSERLQPRIAVFQHQGAQHTGKELLKMARSVAQRSQRLAQASVLMPEHFMAEDKRSIYRRLPEFGDTLRGFKTAEVVGNGSEVRS